MRRPIVRSVTAGLLLASAAALTAHAADNPARRSGLWTLSMSGMGGVSTTMQTCVDASKDKGESIVASRSKACSTPAEFKSIPGGYAFHTVCHMEKGMTIDSKGTIVGDFQSAYTVKSTTTMSPAPAGMAPMSMVMTARFLGVCPADMKPGDVKIGGRVMHPR